MPYGDIGAYVYNEVNNISKCALGHKMCGLGIEMCALGPKLAFTYSTLLGTMIYTWDTYGIF